jgi:murein L,D-transpeptidase YafK
MGKRVFTTAVQVACTSLLLLGLGQPTTAKGATLPTNLLIAPEAKTHHVILVEKASQQLFVYEFDGVYHLVSSYRCATGENEGDKQASGDRKTPEGIYFFTKACDEKHLNPTYGARAFPMNYPNLMDEQQDKDGNGIWLHGTNEALKERSTNGCIAMRNEDIVQLDPYIRLWETPIIVEEKLTYHDQTEAEQQGRDLALRIEGWREAWSQKQLDRYLSYYTSAFRWKNLDLQGWRQKKERLNRLYSKISVQLDDIHLFRQGKVVLASFDELYRSDRFASHGLKLLYLVQNSAEWRILGEEWRRSDHPSPAPLKLAAKPSVPVKSPEASIEDLVETWRRAWEKGDMQGYMACYHPDFQTDGMNIQGWKSYKKKLFRRSAERAVQLSDIQIQMNGTTALATFKQRYQAARHQDYGLKTLHLAQHKGRWTILKETWEPLPDQA